MNNKIPHPFLAGRGVQSLSHAPVLKCVTAPFAQGSLPSGNPFFAERSGPFPTVTQRVCIETL